HTHAYTLSLHDALPIYLLVGLNTAALAEALVLGAKGGLAPATLLAVLKESAAGSRMVDVRGPLMVDRRFDPQMKIDLFLKDFTLDRKSTRLNSSHVKIS